MIIMDHKSALRQLALSEQACTLLALSITQIVLGCMSIVGNFGRSLFGIEASHVHVAFILWDLAIGALLLATGSFGTSLSQKARWVPGNFGSFRILAALNIVLSIIHSVYLTMYTVLLILVSREPDLAVRALSSDQMEDEQRTATLIIPVLVSSTILPLWLALLVTVAELLIAAIAANISQQISTGTAANMERGGGATYTIQASAPPAQVTQSLLKKYEKDGTVVHLDFAAFL